MLQIGWDSFYHFKNIFVTACIKDFWINDTKIGDKEKEVQIDETLFNRMKYNGVQKRTVWDILWSISMKYGLFFPPG